MGNQFRNYGWGVFTQYPDITMRSFGRKLHSVTQLGCLCECCMEMQHK